MYNTEDKVIIREIRRGEIYFVDLSNVDYAESHISGKSRPGLIVQNDVGNNNSTNVIVALLTSADKKPYPFQHKIDLNGRPTTIMLDQLMTISKDNLENKLGELSEQDLYETDLALMCSLSLLPHSITTIKDFNISRIITERTRDKEIVYCNIEICNNINNKDIIQNGNIFINDLNLFDSSITKDTELDEIKDKLNNCAGLNFIANHIQF